MATVDIERLLVKFNRNRPADESDIQKFEAESGIRLPSDYVMFLQQTDGGEGFIGKTYIILWSVKELLEMNRAYEVGEYAPGLFLFGSNGGGEAFAFDIRSDSKTIVSVPFVGMELKLAVPVSTNFIAFAEKLFESK